MKTLEENYDIVVVGAGHAGCEASPENDINPMKSFSASAR